MFGCQQVLYFLQTRFFPRMPGVNFRLCVLDFCLPASEHFLGILQLLFQSRVGIQDVGDFFYLLFIFLMVVDVLAVLISQGFSLRLQLCQHFPAVLYG